MKNVKTIFETRYSKDKVKGVYRTKSLTDLHRSLHLDGFYDHVVTAKIELNSPSPLGWAEIIAITNKAKPKQNKPFEI